MADAVRACSKCGIAKPHTFEFFPMRWRRGGKHLGARCRPCEAEDQRERYARSPEGKRKWLREYRRKHPERVKQWDRENNGKNKAPGSDYQKRKYARLDKRKALADLKKWKLENPDKVRDTWIRTYQKNREKHAARSAKWALENPESRAASRDRRRAKEVGAAGSYTREEVRALLREAGRVCFYCRCALKKFHADHFIPLARGGSNTIENIRLSCPSCNYSKGARLPWEWKPEVFGMTENASR